MCLDTIKNTEFSFQRLKTGLEPRQSEEERVGRAFSHWISWALPVTHLQSCNAGLLASSVHHWYLGLQKWTGLMPAFQHQLPGLEKWMSSHSSSWLLSCSSVHNSSTIDTNWSIAVELPKQPLAPEAAPQLAGGSSCCYYWWGSRDKVEETTGSRAAEPPGLLLPWYPLPDTLVSYGFDSSVLRFPEEYYRLDNLGWWTGSRLWAMGCSHSLKGSKLSHVVFACMYYAVL